MKRRRGADRPVSLFPHEIRRQCIIALLCVFSRLRREEPDSAMARLPRDIVRIICGWVKADFTQQLCDGRRNWYLIVWTLSDHVAWISEDDYVLLPCTNCLAFPHGRLVIGQVPEKWKCSCQHVPINFNVKWLREKYTL